jgi:hypothetical protein
MTKRWTKQTLSFLLLTLVMSVLHPVTSADNRIHNVPTSGVDVAGVATKIAGGLGVVRKTMASGDKGPIFVFEEYHTSRVGQLQIATMLLRLHDGYGLKKIGLEGAIQSPKAIDTSWFHAAGGEPAKKEREDAAVRMLADGEISSAEFMALAFPDVEVYGTELAQQYNVKLDEKSSPELSYLIAIAGKTLPQKSVPQLNRLIQQKDKKQALEFLLDQDPWVRAHYAALKDRSSSINCAQQAARMAEIQAKADSVGADVDAATRQAADKATAFYKTCDERSLTMVNSVLSLQRREPSEPIAMQIGAGHTDGVVELLRQNNATFAVIRPIALNPGYANLSAEQFLRKSAGKFVRNSPGTLGKLLNAEKKPPPILGTANGNSLASMNFACLLVAERARSRRLGLASIADSVPNLPGFRVDRDTFERDGDDVVFHAWLKDNNEGTEKSVWARVGSLSTQQAAMTLEQKLKRAISDLTPAGDGGGLIPPTELPPGSQPAKEEGPRDAKRGDIVISRIGLQELAVFAATRDDVKQMARISN